MATSSPYSSNLQEIVTRRKGYAGLAIIITNDYSTATNCNLPGAEKDGDNLSKVFINLNFAVYWHKNVSCPKLHDIIGEVRSLKYHHIENYSCILFIFAGHGCDNNKLCMQDEGNVNLFESLVSPLTPGNCKELGTIPKVYLIDACRGEMQTKTTLSPRGNANQEETICDRGGILQDDCHISDESNFLIARSTLPMHKAYEDKQSGGIWFSVLAQTLHDLKERMSISDILTKVNENLLEKQQKQIKSFQQPEMLSRLNRGVFLEPCKYSSKKVEDIPSIKPRPVLILAPSFSGSSHPVYPQKNSDVQSDLGSIPVPSTSPIEQHRAPCTPAVQYPAEEKFLIQFHEYCQSEHLTPRYDYTEDESGKKTTFKCTISYKKNGKTFRGGSGRSCLSKDEAKERAAQDILGKVV